MIPAGSSGGGGKKGFTAMWDSGFKFLPLVVWERTILDWAGLEYGIFAHF